MEELLTDYKNLPVVDLVRIAEYPKFYQARTIQAARREIQRRQISQKEIDEIRNYLNEGRPAEEAKQISDSRTTGQFIKKLFDPHLPGLTYPEKVVRWVTIILSVFAGFHLVLSRWLANNNIMAPATVIVFTITSLVMYMITISLWHNKSKIGWGIVVIYFTSEVYSLLIRLFFSDGFVEVVTPNLIVTRIIFVVFYLGILWVISSRQLRLIFQISSLELVGAHILAFGVFVFSMFT